MDINKSMYSSFIIMKWKQKYKFFPVLSQTLKIICVPGVLFKEQEIIKRMNRTWKGDDWYWIPLRLQICVNPKVDVDRFIRSLSWVKKTKEVQFNISWEQDQIEKIILKLIKKFSHADFNLDITSFHYNWKHFYINEKLPTIVIGDSIFRCKNHKQITEIIRINGWDLIENQNDDLFALKIWGFRLLHMCLVQDYSQLKISKSFIDKIKNISKVSKSVYIFTTKQSLTLHSSLINMSNDHKYFLNCTKAFIWLDTGHNLEETIIKIRLLPKDIAYKFEIYEDSGKCLKFLEDEQFVKEINLIKGQFSYKDVEIEVKLYETKDLENLKEKIDKPKNKPFFAKYNAG